MTPNRGVLVADALVCAALLCPCARRPWLADVLANFRLTPLAIAAYRVAGRERGEATVSDETQVRDRLERLLAEHDPTKDDAAAFLGAQYDLGLAWVHFAEGDGGLGVSPALQPMVDAALAEVG